MNDHDSSTVPQMSSLPSETTPLPVVQHVMVVGFHHKRGCLVEFCYPSIQMDPTDHCDDPVELPGCWQILASLAIPDGAHNFDSDTVFFTIPDHRDPSRTIFGVSCYRQIATKDLLVKSPDITRSSVQKAVIVLMNYPVFGLIEYKLDIITRVYFAERDFSKTAILVDAYNELNRHISPAIVDSPDILAGLSIRSLFVRFGSQVIVLFKMLMIEKKVIFLHSPIRELTSSILTLCSLMPGLIQEGLMESAIVYDKKHRPEVTVRILDKDEDKDKDKKTDKDKQDKDKDRDKKDKDDHQDDPSDDHKDDPTDKEEDKKTDKLEDKEKHQEPSDKASDKGSSSSSSSSTGSDEEETEAEMAARLLDQWNKPASLHGLPLPLFTCHAHVMPYFSISYFDILTAPTVRSFIGGSSNHIFRKSAIDIFVVGSQIEIDDPSLRRVLRPSTEDMHFISYLLKAILNDNESSDAVDIFDDTQQEFYEGSDEWIRMHFKSYLLHLLRCSRIADKESPEYKAFNPFYMEVFRDTESYKKWTSGSGMTNVMKDVEPIHPFSSNRLGYLKLRLQNLLIQRQEQLNQSITKVASAGGQVLNQAKSTVNTWLSSIGTSLHERARDASLAASTSTWKSYIPASIATRATQILSPTEAPPTSGSQQHVAATGSDASPEKKHVDTTPPYTPEESETSV